MQPFWQDDVYFEGGNGDTIEVCLMEYVHIADESNDGTYVRSLLTNMLDVQDTINNDIFGTENDANTQPGQVLSFLQVLKQVSCCSCSVSAHCMHSKHLWFTPGVALCSRLTGTAAESRRAYHIHRQFKLLVCVVFRCLALETV